MEHSQNLSELALALARAQGEIQDAKKDLVNGTFGSNYADLTSTWSACRRALSSNGLSVIQIPLNDGLETMLLHSSGQFIKGVMPFPEDNTNESTLATPVQRLGTVVTYIRRYMLASMVGVAPKGEDTDGQIISFNKMPMPKKVETSKVVEIPREAKNA